MAIKPLKTIKFPGLPDTYTVPQVDSVPTQGSTNAVSSGSVYDIQTALEKIGAEIDITDTIHFTQGGGVQYNYEGKVTNSTTASFSGYVDVSKFDKIRLTMRLNVNSSSYGIAFYKEPNLSDGSFLGGVQENYGAEQASAEVRTIDIPEDANYIRTTWIKNDQSHYSDYTFSCVGIINGRVGELEDNVSNLTDICDSIESVRIPLYPCQFIGNAYKNASGTASDNDHCIVTERPLVFKNYGSVHVYTTNNNLSFSWKLSTDSALKTGIKDFRFSGDVELQLNILTDDSTPVKSSDLSSIVIETTETVYNHYIADNFFKPITSNRFEDFGGDNIHRYGMYNTGDQIGFAQRGNAYYRITSMPCICEHDLTIYCGINNSLNLEILVNGTLTTIQYGQWFKVPKNTVFAVAFKSTSRNSNNNISTSGIYIIDDSVPSADITQYISQAVVTRADCGFMVDDKVFLISSTGLYSVYGSGGFLVKDASIDHTAGHANSCNYYNGKVYVSDWTDNTLIHVYNVDAENNALTYNKDIVIPIENVGRVEYFVRNDENEVFFIGWQNGDSSVNPNTLIYGLYVLTTEGYEQSWIRKAFRPKVLQSFTMQGNYIYMVECDTNYKTTGIIILNLETGLSSFSEAIGTITTFESETIIPIGLQSFILADSRGRLFLKTVVL